MSERIHLPPRVLRLLVRHGARLPVEERLPASFEAIRALLLQTGRLRAADKQAVISWLKQMAGPAEVIYALNVSTWSTSRDVLLPNVPDSCLTYVVAAYVLAQDTARRLPALRKNPLCTPDRLREVAAEILAGAEASVERDIEETARWLKALAQLEQADSEMTVHLSLEPLAERVLDFVRQAENPDATASMQLSLLLQHFPHRLPSQVFTLWRLWVERAQGTNATLVLPSLTRRRETPLHLLRDMARTGMGLSPLPYLAESRQALADPEIRRAILARGSAREVLAAAPFLEDAAERRQAFLRLVETSPSTALEWTKDFRPADFQAAELAPLLQAPETETRLGAMAWMGGSLPESGRRSGLAR